MTIFTKGQEVTNGETLYRVLTVHQDGSVTLQALWGLDKYGRPNYRGGFRGSIYRRQKPASLNIFQLP